jgi:1,4-alpha-glucan branching enzyme
MTIGSFCLVLHGHMPYVLHHGQWPHGEDWLYEAAAETYLPLLALLDECSYLNVKPRLTIGLTPVLAEQLAHEHFKQGFEAYLRNRIEQAETDRKYFEKNAQPHLAWLAERWAKFYQDLFEQFERIGYDIPAAFRIQARRGSVELLTSAATHGYLPLLLEDSSIKAQIRAGLNSSRRILGIEPEGIWFPEGAYRPAGRWTPATEWGGPDWRRGLDELVSEEGLSYFFVDEHMFTNGGGNDRPSVHQPVWVDGNGGRAPLMAAFARDPYICKQVWCGFVGYPADGVYLEFHKRHGQRRGLRYWKVTDCKSGLDRKDFYYPDDVPGRIYQQTQHFCSEVKHHLLEHYQQTGKPGIVVACFDAELFGHWWFEGPSFLRDVLLTLSADPEVELRTAGNYLGSFKPDRAVHLPAGSWGEGGDHRVWASEQVKWLWEIEYRCETSFGKLTYHLDWRQKPELRKILQKAGRELLLLQASDWPFVITRRQAQDYGIQRFIQHVARFDMFSDMAEKLAEDPYYISRLDNVQKIQIKEADMRDVIFQDIDLNWWNC